MRKIILITFVGVACRAFAQEAPPKLITDRPDQTESSAVVPLHHLQIESGFVMETKEEDVMKHKSFAYNSTLLRYGLASNFELRLGIEYLGENTEVKSTGISSKTSGLSPLYAGFKAKISEENGWMPEVAFLGGLVFPFTAAEDFKPEYTGADFRFSLSHTLTDKLSLGYNLGVQWDGISVAPAYFYSLALGYTLTNKIGVYAESFGSLPETGDAEHLLDGGLTYLLLPNLQLDLTGGLGIRNAIDSFVSVGFSYRLPD